MPDSSDTQLPEADDPALELWRHWQTGLEPDVPQLLRRAGHLTIEQVLAMLRVDQRERWRRGQPLPAETYLQWCPALERDPEKALELIWAEYVLREELGQAPQPEEYFRRFPQYGGRLQQQIALHKALAASDASASAAGAPADLALPEQVGRFRLKGEIGRGGMGAVLRGHDPDLGRDWRSRSSCPSTATSPPTCAASSTRRNWPGNCSIPVSCRSTSWAGSTITGPSSP
jgi:hypothetical protein